jgi:hypothetical protein
MKSAQPMKSAEQRLIESGFPGAIAGAALLAKEMLAEVKPVTEPKPAGDKSSARLVSTRKTAIKTAPKKQKAHESAATLS